MFSPKILAIIPLSVLAACGGGGSGGNSSGSASVTPPVNGTVTQPASTSSADLISFLEQGATTVSNPYGSDKGISRVQRTATVNGETVTVTADRFADGTYGLIQYVSGDNTRLYTLDDGLVATTKSPDGRYNGTFEVNYTVDGGNTWNVGTGDSGIVLDTATGKADFGGMATAYNSAGSNSVEYYSTSDLVGGKFSDNSAIVNYRENGAFVEQYQGTIEGTAIDVGDSFGVVGLVGGDDGVFQANGGFTSIWQADKDS